LAHKELVQFLLVLQQLLLLVVDMAQAVVTMLVVPAVRVVAVDLVCPALAVLELLAKEMLVLVVPLEVMDGKQAAAVAQGL
jgi:hypothetical protein